MSKTQQSIDIAGIISQHFALAPDSKLKLGDADKGKPQTLHSLGESCVELLKQNDLALQKLDIYEEKSKKEGNNLQQVMLQEAITYLKNTQKSGETPSEEIKQAIITIAELCNHILAAHGHVVPQSQPLLSTLELPKDMPLFEDREDKSVDAIQFYETEYAPYIKAGILYRNNLRGKNGLDDKLVTAIYRQCRKESRDIDDVLPPKNTARVSKDLDNAPDLQELSRLFNAATKRKYKAADKNRSAH